MKIAKNFFVLCAAVALILVSVHMCVADNFNMKVVEQNGIAKLQLTYNQKQYEVALTPVGQTNVQTGANTQATAPQTAQTTAVTLEQAKNIALKDAGLTSADFIKAKQDFDDGRQIFELEFRNDGKEYDYDIDASTGRILKTDIDYYNNIFGSNNQNGQSAQQTTAGAITAAEAENIALKDAGIAKSAVRYIYSHNDKEDGRAVYEVEFALNNTKYEYQIDASNGKIYDKDIDRD